MDESFISSPDGAERDARHRPLYVVGVDGSDSGRAALCQAADEAGQADARILCVHVRCQPSIGEMAALVAPGAALASRDCRDLIEMQAWLDCVQILDPLPCPWEFQVVMGRPDKILREVTMARHGDALFVGQSPRTGRWARLFHRCPARRLARAREYSVHLAITP
ncbi:universal stress protein [Actinoallomurus rhizosphaericola]|uniref:universal stress protein n=1 Tax=Actinoallomurus rhizosphaericola TaxID=2952536 RepID=UPI0020931362|nr:universal stress protein [Actinoallomurus rhizosphaericola]MCO5997207.1 universal stress protein [Actinoallomurus rhizosphaericola]